MVKASFATCEEKLAFTVTAREDSEERQYPASAPGGILPRLTAETVRAQRLALAESNQS